MKHVMLLLLNFGSLVQPMQLLLFNKAIYYGECHPPYGNYWDNLDKLYLLCLLENGKFT